MIWPFRRPPTPKPSTEAVEASEASDRALTEARALRQESQRVGAALRQVHHENHIAAALVRAIAKGAQ